MGYTIKKTEGYKSAENASKNTFDPLPAGKYAVSIYEASTGEYKRGGNIGKEFLKIQFKVLDGQPGANRRLFENIGLFDRWAPTAKNPDGSDNFTFFGFFAAVTGKTEKEFRQWFDATEDPFAELPSPTQLEGRKVLVNLKIVPDTYAFSKAEENGDLEPGQTQEDFKTNDVSGYKVYDGTLPAGGEANTSSPKVQAVDL